MQNYHITLLPGDGIGPEITKQAVRVLECAAEKYAFSLTFTEALIGGIAIAHTGCPLPEETLAVCRSADAVLLGAVGGPQWDTLPGDKRPEAGLLGIRTALGLFANLRPAIMYPQLRDACPLKPEIVGEKLDLLVVRELTGGIYFGERGREYIDGVEGAYDTERYSVPEIERIARAAFEAARRRGKSAHCGGRVHSVDKANVLESSRLWRETVTRIGRAYPDVALIHMYVDNAAMQLVRDPGQFDVLLTNNMFGDILSDEASQIAGSIGMLPSASLRADKFGLYEPVHGSAPELAGQDTANPLAAILSAAMLLRYSLEREDAAVAVENAVQAALEDGLRTADIWSNECRLVGTAEMGNAVVEKLM
ncbi:MAG: 3-isopropylmalate dehydrogenase [Oscillospiraceae bacterium]|nr:3-isopropylmalate dehydrogenase [Oscillospiraceae bacterium]